MNLGRTANALNHESLEGHEWRVIVFASFADLSCPFALNGFCFQFETQKARRYAKTRKEWVPFRGGGTVTSSSVETCQPNEPLNRFNEPPNFSFPHPAPFRYASCSFAAFHAHSRLTSHHRLNRRQRRKLRVSCLSLVRPSLPLLAPVQKPFACQRQSAAISGFKIGHVFTHRRRASRVAFAWQFSEKNNGD